MYFTQVHEDAILEYCKSKSKARREELYVTLIQPAFDELVDKIVYTYKFNSLPNCDILKEDCKVFLVTILEKFDVEKGYKAFTYFSVITKNWFIAETKKRKKKLQKEVALDVSDTVLDEKLIVRNTYIQDRTKAEFIEVLHEEIVWWKEETSSAQDRKILEAVEVLFESVEQIDIFNKKAVYVYLREITGFSTKQITSSLTKVRKKYRNLRAEWDNGEI
jgi:hypothetical protein